ncbi:MAG: ABC transporter permease, partial [Rhodospirillaceae bacterium]
MSQLRKILEIGRVNLLRQVRDRGDLFFVFVLPMIIIVALGLQFGGWASARLGVVAPAGDPAAEALIASIAADPTGFDIRRLDDRADLEARVGRGQLEAGLVIPDGFADTLAGSGTAEVVYLGTADALTTGLRAPIDAAVARLGAVTTATRVAVGEGLGTQAEAAAAAGAGYEIVPGVQVDVTQVGEPGMFAGFSQFTFGASTQLILFMFLTSMTAATRLVTTRQLGVSRRMTATPTAAWTIVTGEALGRFLVAILQAVFIVVVTAVAFNVSWGDPLATGTLILLFGIVCSGFA